MPPAWRSFLLSLLAFLPVAVLVFLWDCSFFVAWDGQAVSVAPSRAEEPASYVVRIQEGESREVRTANWDAAVVRQLSLPVDAVEMAPIQVPETAPDTDKARFSLSYRVQVGEGTDQARFIDVPTTSPRSVGIAALVFLLLAAVRNMVVAGSPVALQPVNAKNATAAPPSPSGNPSPRPKSGGSRKGPPPGKRRKGQGRR
jgi:hypothetical protein